MKIWLAVWCVGVLGVVAPPVLAGDTAADRATAVQRYLRAVPSTRLYNDMLAEMARQLPAAQRDVFMAELKKSFNPASVDRITTGALVKGYTADEINALAEFYESKHGASVMKKMPQLMAEIMPGIQQEVFKVVQKIEQRPPGNSSR